MKKILCFALAFLLSFNAITCNVFAEDFSGSSTDYNIPSKDTLKELPADAPKSTETFLKHVYFQPMTDFFNSLGIDIWGDNKVWSEDTSKFILDNAAKDNNVTTDGNYYYINANFIKNINQKVQENLHALDGYYLIEPYGPLKYDTFVDALTSIKGWDTSDFTDYMNSLLNEICSGNFFYIDGTRAHNYNYALSNSYSDRLIYIHSSDTLYSLAPNSTTDYRVFFKRSYSSNSYYNLRESGTLLFSDIKRILSVGGTFTLGAPLKIFYSKEDALKYRSNGRTYYAPKLPFSNIRIPVTYINNINNSGLPDFNFNTGSLVGKAEADVQADIDLALKNYLDHLIELNNNKPAPTSTPTPTKPPTPTKAPTSTPAPATPITVTPTPVLPNVTVSPTPPPEDFSSINKWLEQIYNWLLDFGDKNQTFTEKICKYIDSTDGKLDQIIEAIDRLSHGDTTGEANGCKYDYTVLSEFMTQLWNESDKKFDKMVKLLEENNEYQQKIVDSLNQIKALLVADTVLDVFRNRSNETANKAKEKFPTSLPWDIALVVNAFSAPPKEPVIELPIKIESMHIDEKIVVDLSSEEWVKLAKTCRYLLSILFVLYMVHLSRKFFSKGDD